VPLISTAWKVCGRQAEASTLSALISSLLKTRTLPVSTFVAERKSCRGAAWTAAKSTVSSTMRRSGLKLNGLRSYGLATA
jgi:hypothetical protein